MNARPGWRELHPPLAVHLGLLLLTILLLGAMPAIEAAGGGTEHAVVTGIMAGDAADDGALDAALGLGSLGGKQRQRRDGHGKHGLHDRAPQMFAV
jgi:hypothetical protein